MNMVQSTKPFAIGTDVESIRRNTQGLETKEPRARRTSNKEKQEEYSSQQQFDVSYVPEEQQDTSEVYEQIIDSSGDCGYCQYSLSSEASSQASCGNLEQSVEKEAANQVAGAENARNIKKKGLLGRIKKGFTLVESLIVVSIIGLLLTITVPTLQRARKITKYGVESSNIKSFSNTLETVILENRDKLPEVSSWGPSPQRYRLLSDKLLNYLSIDEKTWKDPFREYPISQDPLFGTGLKFADQDFPENGYGRVFLALRQKNSLGQFNLQGTGTNPVTYLNTVLPLLKHPLIFPGDSSGLEYSIISSGLNGKIDFDVESDVSEKDLILVRRNLRSNGNVQPVFLDKNNNTGE